MTRENHRQTFHNLMAIALEIYERRWHQCLSSNESEAPMWKNMDNILDQFHKDWLFQLQLQSRSLIPSSNFANYQKTFSQFKTELYNQKTLRFQMTNAVKLNAGGAGPTVNPINGGTHDMSSGHSNRRPSEPEVADWSGNSKSDQKEEKNRVLLQLAEMVGASASSIVNGGLYNEQDFERIANFPFDQKELQSIHLVYSTRCKV
eukprot:Selendium_serpulae@DN5293_c0_g1_i1.p1